MTNLDLMPQNSVVEVAAVVSSVVLVDLVVEEDLMMISFQEDLVVDKVVVDLEVAEVEVLDLGISPSKEQRIFLRKFLGSRSVGAEEAIRNNKNNIGNNSHGSKNNQILEEWGEWEALVALMMISSEMRILWEEWE